MIDIKKINGNEIIDFINSIIKEVLWDYSIQSVEFDSQSVNENRYKLDFMYTCSGWGSHKFSDNYLTITKDCEIRVGIGGNLEGNGCDNQIKNELSKWILTHEFDDNSEYFYILTQELSEDLQELADNETNKIDGLIEKLKTIKSLMK